MFTELEVLVAKARDAKNLIVTEEGCKTSLVLPLLTLLGYDVFNPKHIKAEMVADIGIKRGEKVDYAIMSSGKPKLIIECKKLGDNLGNPGVSQLFRYFTATQVHLAVLTNGVIYKFFSDLEAPNRMDVTPFFEFDLFNYTVDDYEFLLKFSRGRLVGQMKGLIKECRKRKVRAMISESVRFTVGETGGFCEDIATTLKHNKFVSIPKKELENMVRQVTLAESLKVVERAFQLPNLLSSCKSILQDILGKDIEALISYKLSSKSIYLGNASGITLAKITAYRCFASITIGPRAKSLELRTPDDLRKYSDPLRETFTLGNVRS